MVREKFGQHLVDHINDMVKVKIKRKHRDALSAT